VSALVGIYRTRNAEAVQRLVQPALDGEWTVAWWALDDVADELAGVTVGTGPGEKLPLLNATLDRAGATDDWVVFSDDDAVFEQGDVTELVALCEQAGLDLAQPARTDGAVDHRITSARRLSTARRTSFVEIGPVFAVGPRWRADILPFPEERGMGWGLELDWFALHERGCVLGIVDAVRVRHEGVRGEHYDYRDEAHRIHAELAARGFEGWADVQQTLATWRPWQRSPSWTRARAAS
jgi:hypothetical protein